MADESSWTRFWLLGTVPVARAGDDPNHLRSSFSRLVAEAVFWAAAGLLPGNDVRWEAGGSPNRARAVVTTGNLAQTLEIEVGEDGHLRVMISRWSDANDDREWRSQPFGGTLQDFRSFGGFTPPTRVDGGNHFGTGEYFPFYRARVVDISFPEP